MRCSRWLQHDECFTDVNCWHHVNSALSWEQRVEVPGKIPNPSCWRRQPDLQLTCCVPCCCLCFLNPDVFNLDLFGSWVRIPTLNGPAHTVISSLLLCCAAFSLKPFQTHRSEKIAKQDSSDLLPHEDDKTRVDLRPQSKGRQQRAPRKNFIQRHILFGIHRSFKMQ